MVDRTLIPDVTIRFTRRIVATALLVAVVGYQSPGQQTILKPVTQPRAQQTKRPSIVLLGGYTLPLSRQSLTEFWNGGAGGSLQFLVPVQRALSLGIGVDGSFLPFDSEAFATRYPAAADSAPTSDMGFFSVAVLGKVSFLPGMRTTPYTTVSLGASRITGALYKEKVAGVTQRYYDIPRKTRLSAALALGVDIGILSRLALVFEVKGFYVFNDDDLGFMATAQGGLRFRL